MDAGENDTDSGRRISVTVVASDVALSSDFISLDVPADMSINDIKALVEAETNVPPTSQHFLQNGRPITDNAKTLAELNIHEGDVLPMAVQTLREAARRRRSPQGESSSQAPQRLAGGPDPERVRLHILGDATMMEECRRQDPELAEAASSHDTFHNLWNERQRRLEEQQQEKEEQIAALEADPFNVDAQTKIEEMIRQERVQENLQKAMEENPECRWSTPQTPACG